MIAFIDAHREAHGVEPICKVLQIAPSTYYDHVARRRDPARLSARAKRDMALKVEVRRVFEENFRVYGVRKAWRQLQREGFDVARCTVERLMREMGLQGVIRGKPIVTTVSDKAAPCPLDKVNRQFHAPAPNRLWVSDFTGRTGTGSTASRRASAWAARHTSRSVSWTRTIFCPARAVGTIILTTCNCSAQVAIGAKGGRRWPNGEHHNDRWQVPPKAAARAPRKADHQIGRNAGRGGARHFLCREAGRSEKARCKA